MTDEFFRLLFKRAPHPYLVLRPDATFTIVAVNDQYLSATGTERTALVARGLFDVFPDNPNDAAATGVTDLRTSLERVKCEGVPDVMGVQKYDIPKAGTLDEFEVRYWSPVNTPVFDANGVLAYIVHHVEDVTEFILSREHPAHEDSESIQRVQAPTDRKEAEVLLRAMEVKEANRQIKSAMEKSRARLAGVVESAMDAIISIDAQHRVVLFNAAAERIFQRKTAEIIGQQLDQLLPERFRAEHTRHIDGFAKTGESTRAMGKLGILSGLRADGTEFPIEASISQTSIGGELLFTVILRDITERKNAEQALRQAQRMDALGQLTGGIAHDFNNLLTIIIGNHELFDEKPDGEGGREFIRRANEAAQMGARLTSRLLSFARQRKLEPAVIKLNEQVLNMMDLLHRSLGETINLTTALDADLWTVQVDPSEIENAVVNLAINARDAMPQGGRLAIETQNVNLASEDDLSEYGLMPGEYVRLTVSDTGCGMPPEVMARAFEPFFTTKEAGRGTGLGLASIYGFVKQSGGNATIYSEPGRGTTVNLYLPRFAAHETRVSSDAASPVAISAGEMVLVVEDNPELRALSLDRLRRLGYRVIEADGGPAAMVVLRGGARIDLIFSDIVMPGGMTGYELAARAREHTPGIKVLLTSGYDAERAAEQDTTGSDFKVLRKPYRQADLARTLREVLDA